MTPLDTYADLLFENLTLGRAQILSASRGNEHILFVDVTLIWYGCMHKVEHPVPVLYALEKHKPSSAEFWGG